MSIFEPTRALVVPSGYVHSPPLEPEASSSQQQYGQSSNHRDLNNVPMNQLDFAHSMQPRTREQRLQMGSVVRTMDQAAYLQGAQAREDIRGYHKFVDNAQLNNPDPKSSHFAAPIARHEKDFADYDRHQREQERQVKQGRIESRRMQQMHRDIARWEFMEQQDSSKDEQLEKMRKKYKLGQKGNGSASYNPVNNEYEKSQQGMIMQQQEQMRSQRSMHRGNNINTQGHPPFNPINGQQRSQIVPNAGGAFDSHSMSTPVQSRLELGDVGSQVIQGSGRPSRSIGSSSIFGSNYVTPNDVPIGKRVFENTPTVGQLIPADQIQSQWRGKRVEQPLMIRNPMAILKPNSAINSSMMAGNNATATPTESTLHHNSSMPQQVSSQLQNDMRYLIDANDQNQQPQMHQQQEQNPQGHHYYTSSQQPPMLGGAGTKFY